MVAPAFVRRLPALVGAVVVAIGLAACGGPKVALVGTVTDAYTGKPIPAATVSLGSTQATADASGKFEITGWTVKDTLQVSANGYEPAAIPLESQPKLQEPQPPSVTLDTAIRPNTLSGVVTDRYSGKPLAGALVKASDAISATTGSDGRYTLAGVPESFALQVAAPDYAPVTEQVARTTSFDTLLRPTVLTGVLTNQYTSKPVAGATVKVGDKSATTDDQGRYRLADIPESGDLEISADGYAPVTQPVKEQTTFDTALRPDTLKGTLVDAGTGKPIANATVIATLEENSTDVAFARIDGSSDGVFTLKGIPEKGYIKVLAPGYSRQVVPLEAGKVPDTIKLEPFQIKGLYVTAAVVANWDLLMVYFDAIDKTELNTIVMDLKSDLRDDLGLVYYDSQTPLVKELKTSKDYIDYPRVLAEAKRRGIYTIARVHMFSHDNVLAEAKPEWAAKDSTTGGIFYDYPGPGIKYAWLDPWNKNVWEYNKALAVEAAGMGFDEINYDYIRFPSLEFGAGDKERLQLSKTSTPEERFANIAAVLEDAQRAINGAGSFLSIDTFGYTAWRPDGLIGQDISLLAQHTDYIMPMIYPSHFTVGELGFDNPAAHPYEIIQGSMTRGEKFVEGKRAHLRPWLQDFTLTWVPKSLIVEYGPAEVRAQIDAVADVNKDAGWILYDSANVYTDAALKPQ